MFRVCWLKDITRNWSLLDALDRDRTQDHSVSLSIKGMDSIAFKIYWKDYSRPSLPWMATPLFRLRVSVHFNPSSSLDQLDYRSPFLQSYSATSWIPHHFGPCAWSFLTGGQTHSWLIGDRKILQDPLMCTDICQRKISETVILFFEICTFVNVIAVFLLI